MKVVSVINYKGGVGKTTLTANLGAYAAMKGYRVLLIDLDPQTHLTFSFITVDDWRSKYKDGKTIKNYFDSRLAPKEDSKNDFVHLSSLVIPLTDLRKKGCKEMSLISSSLELADMDMDLAGSCSGSSNFLLSSNTLRMFNHLRVGLRELSGDYDVVFIDCPPNCNALVRNALTASDYYVIPARMDYLSSLGVMQLIERIGIFTAEYDGFVKDRPELEYAPISVRMLGVVPMMVDSAFGTVLKAHTEYMRKLRNEGFYVFPYLRHNANVFSFERITKGPVVLTDEKYLTKSYQKTALYKVVNDLYSIGDEVLKRIGLQ